MFSIAKVYRRKVSLHNYIKIVYCRNDAVAISYYTDFVGIRIAVSTVITAVQLGNFAQGRVLIFFVLKEKYPYS